MAFERLDYGGSSSSGDVMIVRLYANSGNEVDDIDWSGDPIPSALRSAMSSLYNYGAIDYWELYSYTTNEYPGISDKSNLSSKFVDWLSNGSANGSGTDLLSTYKGVHLNIHDLGCDTTSANAQAADGCPNFPDAFQRGVAAWTGLCSDSNMMKNSAIQETLHCFIRYTDANVKPLVENKTDNTYEHSLGEVSYHEITPMLTYHADSQHMGVGDCDGDGTLPRGWRQNLSWCTKEAIKRTANNPCS